MSTVAMIVGISGVGKTTFVHRLRADIDFQHLTAGSLIAASKAAVDSERDRLRLSDLDENQAQLIKGLSLARDPKASLILLDGHVVIHANDGLEELSSEVFNQLGVRGFLHLVSDPNQIAINRRNDVRRLRPALSLAELNTHQKASLETTERIAHSLTIPWRRVTYEDIKVAERFLLRLID
jgi:adenylate kinase